MARTSVMAAGGIVLRQGRPPLIAVVRLRKRDEWVLPKGKLDVGETARDAAIREVIEETGHDVNLHEFLGTLVYESGGRSKIVHYWRMEACGGQVHELMTDIREVDWLPVDAAVERLSRAYERAFLANIGPLAVEAALAQRKQKAAPRKRRSRPSAPAPAAPTLIEPEREPEPEPAQPAPELPVATPDARVAAAGDVAAAEPAVEALAPAPEIDSPDPMPVDDPPQSAPADQLVATETVEMAEDRATDGIESPRKTLAQMVREWLGRAA